jgi:hypothetical protein
MYNQWRIQGWGLEACPQTEIYVIYYITIQERHFGEKGQGVRLHSLFL